MGYRYPGNEKKAAIEVFPVTGKKNIAAAGAAGLSESSIPTLRVEGDNAPGLGHVIAEALADAGINLSRKFLPCDLNRGALQERSVLT
jgi:hypothetical protein